jgi:hypothetical protein
VSEADAWALVLEPFGPRAHRLLFRGGGWALTAEGLSIPDKDVLAVGEEMEIKDLPTAISLEAEYRTFAALGYDATYGAPGSVEALRSLHAVRMANLSAVYEEVRAGSRPSRHLTTA